MTFRRPLVMVEVLLLIVGFISLGWAGFATVRWMADSSWQDYRFEQALQGSKTSLYGYLKYVLTWKKPARPDTEQPAAEASQPPTPKAQKLKVNQLIGRIEIPRVKVSAMVREGADAKTLSRAVGHVPYTALPGQKGNFGVAAHRDTFFRGLREVRQGDVIRVVTTQGVYLYEVDRMKIVWPKNVEVLDPTPEKRITLVTCYPFNYVGHAPKRFIVQGKQIGFEALTATSQPHTPQSSASGL
ncbi:MAG TPA: class D sortase [Bryobacteraceae bacterium]|nr:class D sortase [Bryobacteraceae bacterium]